MIEKPLSLRLKHLAQEHRTAILLAYAAREAMSVGKADLPDFVRKVCVIFGNEMEPHFREEEHFIVPRLRDLHRGDIADRILREHAALRASALDLIRLPLPEKVKSFIAAMEAHVAFEEDIAWDVLERALQGTDRVAA